MSPNIFFKTRLHHCSLFIQTQFYRIWGNSVLEAAEGCRPYRHQAWLYPDAGVLGQANEVTTVFLNDFWHDFKSLLTRDNQSLGEVGTTKAYLCLGSQTNKNLQCGIRRHPGEAGSVATSVSSPELGTLSRRLTSWLSLSSLHSSCLCCILGRYENRVSPSQVCSLGTFVEGLPVLPSAWGSAPSVSLSALCVLSLRIFVVILGNTPRTPLSFKYQETRTV